MHYEQRNDTEVIMSEKTLLPTPTMPYAAGCPIPSQDCTTGHYPCHDIIRVSEDNETIWHERFIALQAARKKMGPS